VVGGREISSIRIRDRTRGVRTANPRPNEGRSGGEKSRNKKNGQKKGKKNKAEKGPARECHRCPASNQNEYALNKEREKKTPD